MWPRSELRVGLCWRQADVWPRSEPPCASPASVHRGADVCERTVLATPWSLSASSRLSTASLAPCKRHARHAHKVGGVGVCGVCSRLRQGARGDNHLRHVCHAHKVDGAQHEPPQAVEDVLWHPPPCNGNDAP